LVVYLFIAGLLLGVAAQGVALGSLTISLIVGAFLIVILTSALLGQGVVLGGRRVWGWIITALALILVLLAVTAPAVPGLRSDLSMAAGRPSLYVGPLGWLSGCAAAPEAPTSETEAPAEEDEAPIPEEAAQEPTPAPTRTAPYPTATPVTVPAEPYPLRRVFPETLYWSPEIETGDDGRATLDLALADTITAWRVTALASTLEGAVGAGSYDLPVYRDLFVDVVPPAVVRSGEAVTLTLAVANLLPESQTVEWKVEAVGDSVELAAPEALTVSARSSAGTTWVIRPETPGALTLIVTALGEDAEDRVQIELQVEPSGQ
jgi:hypothetical protein